jgi:hypothetical protein
MLVYFLGLTGIQKSSPTIHFLGQPYTTKRLFRTMIALRACGQPALLKHCLVYEPQERFMAKGPSEFLFPQFFSHFFLRPALLGLLQPARKRP